MRKSNIVKSLLVGLVLIVGMSVVFAGGASEKKAGSYEIDVILMAVNSDYWNMVSAGAYKAAAEFGVKVNIKGPEAETETMKQIQIIEDSITRGADAIVLAALQPASTMPVLAEADSEGIPVVLMDTGIPEYANQVSYVGTKNVDASREAGVYIADQLKAGDKVAIVRGVEGSPTHDDRAQGFIEVMKERGINVATIQPANSERGLGMTVAENIFMAIPDVKAFYCTNDEMALGVLEAAKGVGRSDVIIVGFDGSDDALTSITAGELSASIAQSPINQGYLSVKAAVDHLNGKAVDKRIDTGITVVTKDNVAALQASIKSEMDKWFR
ncbi:MAG: sugar ABC transporter substrate-binding protein [Sphaerochaetaceae bacterium]|jgi:ribose transport system substrate-binding protein